MDEAVPVALDQSFGKNHGCMALRNKVTQKSGEGTEPENKFEEMWTEHQ